MAMFNEQRHRAARCPSNVERHPRARELLRFVWRTNHSRGLCGCAPDGPLQSPRSLGVARQSSCISKATDPQAPCDATGGGFHFRWRGFIPPRVARCPRLPFRRHRFQKCDQEKRFPDWPNIPSLATQTCAAELPYASVPKNVRQNRLTSLYMWGMAPIGGSSCIGIGGDAGG